MRSLSLVFISIVAAASLAACKKQSGPEPTAQGEEPVIKLAPEDIVTIQRGELQTGPRISGALEASARSVVRAETGGTVLQIGPELGQPVKKGDLLARIEAKALGDMSSSAQSGVANAQAQLDLAKREVQRTEALVKGGALAQRELDRAQSQVTAAQAQLNQAKAQLASSQSQLGDATARAPFAGVVARRSVSAGDVVSPGAELYEIIEPSSMRLDASVASEDLSAISVGKSVDFAVRGYPGQMFAGTISRIAPAADPVTRQIQILVEIPNPGGKLIAGLYAEGHVAVEKREALIAPMGAIDMTGDQPSVLRVKSGSVERSVVSLGVRDERAEVVEVLSGLAPGDVLLLARATKNVVPGSKVTIGNDKPAPAPAGSAAPAAAAGSAAAKAAPPPVAVPTEKK